MFKWLSNLIGGKPAKVRRAVSGIKARYDAAAYSEESRRHWANADILSASAANDADIRRRLRSRCRYEVVESNSYARGIISTLANDTIGTGPRLQMLTPNAEANRRIERAFMAWSKRTRFAEKLRTMRLAKAQDGEAFAIMATNPTLDPMGIQLDLRLVEADQVENPTFSGIDEWPDGIEFDAFGNPTFYHVLKEHPGDRLAFIMESERIPAARMLHYFSVDRPGQVRGIPDITTALPLFAQLRRYTLAVIQAAEVAANFAAMLETEAGPDTEEVPTPFESLEIERGMMTTLPAGSKMHQFDAKQPVNTYQMFKHEILNEIARCINMPFNIAACNSSSYNYASGRLDHQTYYKSIRVEQTKIEEVILNRVLMAWFDEAALIPDLLPDNLGPFVDWQHQWFWDGMEHVDPSKEATAQETRLKNHTTTLAAEYAKEGRDWEEMLTQRAKELELMKSLGLSVATEKESPIPEEDDEPEMEEDEEPAFTD